MLFNIWQNTKKAHHKKQLIITLFKSLSIPEDQKELYIQAFDVLKPEELDELFDNLTKFVEKVEMKQIEEIEKESFSVIAGMRKKEAQEKMEEINGFSLLFNNI